MSDTDIEAAIARDKSRREFVYMLKRLRRNACSLKVIQNSLDWKEIMDTNAWADAIYHTPASFVEEINIFVNGMFSEDLKPFEHLLGTAPRLKRVKFIKGSPQTLDILVRAASNNPNIEEVTFKTCRFCENKTDSLLSWLTNTRSLKQLALAYCTVDSQDTAEDLLCYLSNNVSLETLIFQSTDRKLRLCGLIHGIYEHENLKSLQIHVNTCNRDECRLVGRYLSTNLPNLTDFSLQINRPRVNPDLELSAILNGIASNFHLKSVRLRVEDPISCSSAWRNLFIYNKTLKTLDVSTFKLSYDNLRALLDGLSRNSSLEELNLSYSLATAWESSAAAGNRVEPAFWGQLLRSNTALKKLALAGGKLGDESISELSNGLKVNKSLLELDISDNSISRIGLERLLDALSDNSTLHSLDLSANELGTSAGLIAELLVRNQSLRILNLSQNPFGSSISTTSFGSALSESKLVELDLSDTMLGEIGGEEIWTGLLQNKSIQKLVLANNYLSFAINEQAFVEMLAANESLQELDLSLNEHLRGRGVDAIARALASSKGLKRLRALAVDVDDEALALIGDALQTNTSLGSLTLSRSSSSFTEVGFEAFTRKMANMTGLNTLDFGGLFEFDDSSGILLLEAVSNNTAIQSICVNLSLVDPFIRFALDFHLELNRFGRRKFDSREDLQTHLLPNVLAKASPSPSIVYYLFQSYLGGILELKCREHELL